MAFSPAALLNFLRRDRVQDPFGGDDLFDGESRLAGKGPKIALAASGALFLLLVGAIGLIIATGDETVAPVGGSFADLEIEDGIDPAAVPLPGARPLGTQPPAPVVADATAATDRSTDRRPWLAPTTPPTATPNRQGVAGSAAKPPAHEPPAAAATKPPAATPTAHPETKTAAVIAPPAMPNQPPHAGAPPASMPEPAAAPGHEPVLGVSEDIGGIPSLMAAGPAPGAPGRFDLPTDTDTGPAVVGGRPRLAEPALPPTDRIALSAPPPRFANLMDVKHDPTKAMVPVTGAAKLAVIVEGLGLSQSATEAAISKLPAAVTLAFSPYARGLKKWMEKAKESGHEVLIEVPMESKQFPADDPGPLGLLTALEPKENQLRLEMILKESGAAVGVLDSQGSKFREDQSINAVFAKLKELNLFYVQGRPGVRVGETTVPTAVADVVLDERPFRAAVDARLDYAERLAKYQGSAVASLSARPVSFERLVLWIDQAQEKGVSLAPISQVLIR